MSRIIANLYLGDVHDAANHKLLESLDVRCILIIAKEIPPFHSRGFIYMKINAYEDSQFDLKKHFREILPFIHLQLDKGGVLVHCYDGVSRSASVVVGYLMRFRNMSFQKALDFVKAKRPIQPNEQFCRQLNLFEQELKKSNQSQVLGGDSEQVSARKRPRKQDKSTPKFGEDPREERPGELLAKYMKGREGSKSVTKRYCQMLEVYKKIKGGSRQNIRYRSKSKNAGGRDKKTRSVINSKPKQSLTPEDTPRRAQVSGKLMTKSYIAEKDYVAGRTRLGRLNDKALRGNVEERVKPSRAAQSKEMSLNVFDQKKLTMRTLEKDAKKAPKSFLLEGIQFKGRIQVDVPKTNKDRSVPKVTSVSQRFLSCEKEGNLGHRKKNKTNAKMKANAQLEVKNVFDESEDSESEEEGQPKGGKSHERGEVYQAQKRSQFNNSISSNPAQKGRTAHGSKSQTNSVKSQLETKVNSLSKKKNPRKSWKTKGQMKSKLQSKLVKKKSDMALKKQRKCSISPPLLKLTSNMFEDPRNSQPILESVSNNLGHVARALKLKRQAPHPKRRSKLVNPNLEYLNNKFSSSKHNNRIFPFTPRADKSREYLPEPEAQRVSPVQKFSSGERNLKEGLRKEESTLKLNQKKQLSKSSMNKPHRAKLGQNINSNLRSQLIQINQKRSKNKLLTHSPAGQIQVVSKDPLRPANDSRLLERKKHKPKFKIKKTKNQKSKRRNKKKHAKFGSPGISKLKQYYSKLKSHSIDFENPDAFQMDPVDVPQQPRKDLNHSKPDRKRNYQSTKGVAQNYFRPKQAEEGRAQLKQSVRKGSQSKKSEVVDLSNSRSKPKKKSQVNNFLFKKPIFNMRNKAKLSKINLYKDKTGLKPSLTHFKMGGKNAIWGKNNVTQDKDSQVKVFFPNLQNSLEKKFAQRKSETGVINLKQFKFFKWNDARKDPPNVRPSSELNNSLDKSSREDIISKFKHKKIFQSKKDKLSLLRKESTQDKPLEMRNFSEGKKGARTNRNMRLENFREDSQSKEVSKDSTMSLGSEGVSSNGSLNLYSKHKTNRYLVAKKRGGCPVTSGFIQNASSSSKNIGMAQNISLESSENERASANLYQRMALDKNAHKSIHCKNCDLFFCRFENIQEHSKKNEIYRCRYLFVDHLENVTCTQENAQVEFAKSMLELSRKKKQRKILCVGCKTMIGTISEKGEKCSCLTKVNGQFKIKKLAIHLKD